MKRYVGILSLALILLAGAVIFSICLGSVSMSPGEVFRILAAGGGKGTHAKIVWEIRLPRVLAAVILGGGLSVSGFLLQTFFQNPIAGPYVLGISSGAKLFVAMTMIFLLDRGMMITSAGMVASAFVGSLMAMGFVLILSFRVKKMSMLVVCGILIGYICSAITDFFVTFAEDSNIVNLHNWSKGTFSGMGWEQVGMMSICILFCVAAAFFLSKPMAALQMGEAYALSLGVSVKRLRVALILLSSLLSATVTAFAGPISFVGIAVPHLMKLSMKTAKPLVLIPGSFVGGALLTLICDDIARSLFAPTELSISSVTAVFLVPVVMVMMIRRRRTE